MKINHRNIYDIKTVEEYYTKKDGVPCKYICTTSIINPDIPMDIYYRDTPHPKFGNRYFAIFEKLGIYYIKNADKVEELLFNMVEDKDGVYHYSRYTHDYFEHNGIIIDGGREYTRYNAKVFKCFKVKDGEFVEHD